MKRYGIVTLIIGMLALAATFDKAAWAETAQNKASATTQLSSLAAATGLTEADPVPSPEGVVAPGELAVSITSFVMTGQKSTVAEICGKVTGSDAEFTVVRIVVDPKYKPGTYNTLAAKDGSFCSVVVTYTRTASASVTVLGKNSTSKVATASEKNTR